MELWGEMTIVAIVVIGAILTCRKLAHGLWTGPHDGGAGIGGGDGSRELWWVCPRTWLPLAGGRFTSGRFRRRKGIRLNE